MPEEFQVADYALCTATLVAAVMGMFRGFSGTLAFALATAAASTAATLGWSLSPALTDSTWQRVSGVVTATVFTFGIVRLVVKKLVNKLLTQPSDAIFGGLVGAGLGVAAVVVWAYSGLFPEYSSLVRTVASYIW